MSHNRRFRYRLKTVNLVLILLFFKAMTYGQIDTTRQPPIQSDIPITTDTLKIEKKVWQPDPKKALWYSLAVPGLGQIYNHSWWKTPLIYGGLGVSIWFIRDNNQNYKDFRTAYSESFDSNTDNQLVKKYPNQESLKRIRDVYYKRYQLSIIATAAIYLMNGLEAYVDAHLKNFEISDDLSFHYGHIQTDKNFQSSISITPNVFPVIGIAYKLE